MQTCNHASMQTYKHANIHPCMHAYICAHRHTYIPTDIHSNMHGYIDTMDTYLIHRYIDTTKKIQYMQTKKTDINSYMHTLIHSCMHACHPSIQTYMHLSIHQYRHTYIQTCVNTVLYARHLQLMCMHVRCARTTADICRCTGTMDRHPANLHLIFGYDCLQTSFTSCTSMICSIQYFHVCFYFAWVNLVGW